MLQFIVSSLAKVRLAGCEGVGEYATGLEHRSVLRKRVSRIEALCDVPVIAASRLPLVAGSQRASAIQVQACTATRCSRILERNPADFIVALMFESDTVTTCLRCDRVLRTVR